MKTYFMTDSVRRMMIGFSFMFGLHLVVARIAQNWFASSGDNNNIVGISLIFTIALYLGGGLVMGLLAKRVILIELFTVTLLAIMFNILLSLSGIGADFTLISQAITTKANILTLLINISLVIITMLFGAFCGSRIVKPIDDWVSRTAMLLATLSIIIGPYFLLTTGQGDSNLPRYVVALLMITLFVIFGIGYLLSMREHHEADDLTISPDHHKIL